MQFSRYIKVDVYEEFETIDSELYGTYVVRKIAEVNLLDAFTDQNLKEGYDSYERFEKKGFGCRKTKRMEYIERGGQKISNFYFYIAFVEDNKDWVDPKGYLKKLPVALTFKQFNKQFKLT